MTRISNHATLFALGTDAKRLDKPIKSIRLLGGDNKPLVWKQDGTALSITCPDTMSFMTAVTFEIE